VSATRARAAGRRKRTHGRRPRRARDAFEVEVQHCARALALMRPRLLAQYSAAALAAALVIQAVRALAQCVCDGTLPLEEARGLIARMAELKLPR